MCLVFGIRAVCKWGLGFAYHSGLGLGGAGGAGLFAALSRLADMVSMLDFIFFSSMVLFFSSA